MSIMVIVMNNLTPEQSEHLTDLCAKWLCQIELRNNRPYGSKGYTLAETKAEALEVEASMLVYGDAKHSMSECLNGVDA